MKTDDLIGRLSAEAPAAPLRPAAVGLAILAATLACSALFLGLLGPRDELGTHWLQPVIALKTLLPLLAAALALPLTLRTLRPAGRPGPWLALLLLPLGGAVAVWLLAYRGQPPAARFADMTAPAIAECLGFIVLLSLPPLLLALALFRRGASTRPALTGALIGLACSAGAAAGYSLFCVQDDPVFYVTWYGLAILIVTSLSALAGARWLRW